MIKLYFDLIGWFKKEVHFAFIIGFLFWPLRALLELIGIVNYEFSLTKLFSFLVPFLLFYILVLQLYNYFTTDNKQILKPVLMLTCYFLFYIIAIVSPVVFFIEFF